MARSSALSSPLALLLLALAPLAGCGPSQNGAVTGMRFDLCQPLVLQPDTAATADQLTAAGQALALWNQRAGARLALAGDPGAAASAPSLPLHFQTAAGNFHGLYDGQTVQVFINNDLAGHPLTVTIAHELGHSYGLVHVPADQRPSVMNPGNLTVEPNAEDAAALAALWGSCSDPAASPEAP